MTKVQRYIRPEHLDEARAAKLANPGAAYLSGGTLLLAGDSRPRPELVIDLSRCVIRDIVPDGDILNLGASATFQELVEADSVAPCVVEAALSMANRNTRNRATIGGNIAADKSCSSLIPLFLALGARLLVTSPFNRPSGGPGPTDEILPLETWLVERERHESARASDLVLGVMLDVGARRGAAYRRWNRVACDLSVLGAAVALELDGNCPQDLRIAIGGLGPRARRFPDIERLFEGSPLPPREEIEAAVAHLLHPIDDLRASAAFKRLRASQLIAEALLDAATRVGGRMEP